MVYLAQIFESLLGDEGCEYLSKANWPLLKQINLRR